MPVQVQHGGKRSVPLAQRTVKVARHEQSGERLEVDLLHTVTLPLDPIEHPGLERRPVGRGIQAATQQDLIADELGLRLPVGRVGAANKCPGRVLITR